VKESMTAEQTDTCGAYVHPSHVLLPETNRTFIRVFGLDDVLLKHKSPGKR